ncbi:MAG: D-alanyl-D-alanine carboxypeptidase/D-alanyl-D-alanine-endopeptidase [Balneolaceae bacterium]|nr:D-alanyl-D-alanine carboxypeptidase/D-alanyl-D-alanine-endopeptidase [Balneolaceae bacterium]MBO6547393.1 D-alanyl-D-alanine carboxypeptidase/D-alanyl-D-alanine-endopeptidase [Balneolaceae bacterium]MBO6647660.1 D-alanyl-D-alanine carboxypeptidase/D-alanyl-D-alanine-endopeptidase [Balneolaceae bacterium]
MKFIIRNVFLLTFLLVAVSGFSQDLNSIISSASNQEALWSVTVRDSEGNILESYNQEKLIIPASNQKLFTTATVLDGLGSDFRYTTNIYGDGILVDSVWEGNLIIKGSGDPSISGFMYGENRYFVFGKLVSQLKELGIYEINGSLIADVSYFDHQIYPKGWDWDDLSFYYGVEIAPLSFNNNAVDLVVIADGEVGSKPRINWFPENTSFVNFINYQTITPAGTKYDEFYQRDMGSNRIVLASKLPKGYIEEESLSISGAAMFFLQSFRHFMIQSGINTPGSYLVQNPNPDVQNLNILASHNSEPLSKLIEWTNKESDNFYTEMLLKTLDAEKSNQQGSFEYGIKEVRKFLGGMEIDTTYVIMKDGSGMASGNFTKTSILSEFLVKMQYHPEFEAFYRSMSVAGIDGTIVHRMKGTALYRNFKGKSGYVGGVRTLSGYFTTSSGEQLIVSMAANNFIGKVRPIDAVHERILAYLYAKY